MISEKLANAYNAAEEKYYNLLDFLDKKGLPVYGYNDFLENRGIPAFPFTIAILLVIIAAIFALGAASANIDTTFTFVLENQYGDPVDGVIITIKDLSGAARATKTISSGGTLQVTNIPMGTKLEITAEKDGYETASVVIAVNDNFKEYRLELEQIINPITARLSIVDSESNDGIANAHVIAQWKDITAEGYTDASGLVSLQGIPGGVQVSVTIESDAYETTQANMVFEENATKSIPLSPKSISLQGNSRLIVVVKDNDGALLDGALVTIKNNETEEEIFRDEPAENGEFVTSEIPKGTSVSLTVQKDGFLRYDSAVLQENKTLRLDEEPPWEVFLRKGGEKLVVTTYAEGKTLLGNVTVQIFDMENNLVASEITGFGGSAEFNNLEGMEFYITGWREGYLPAREKANVAETEGVALTLISADASNSVNLAVYVRDSMMGAANNASVRFFEKAEEELFPLGVPLQQTDLSGFVSVQVSADKTIVVKASKDLEEGEGEKKIESGMLNEIKIDMQKGATVVELKIFDEEGNPAEGRVRITAPNGDYITEEDFTGGSVLFDAKDLERVNVEVTTADGKTYTEQVNVKGQEEVTINLGAGNDAFAPSVEFKGIFNSRGEPVDGVAKDDYYWLKFEMAFADAIPKGGLHVRVGSDEVKFADSQEIGIFGFDAAGANSFFGKSYQPLPSPGNESVDRQNKASAGEKSKFVELYFNNPSNTVVAKVKVKAETTALIEEFEVHYRAWSTLGGKYYRTPQDSGLGEDLFTDSKTPLYAETTTETVHLFETEASCKDELCAAYRFLNEEGLIIEETAFKPIKGNVYAMEIDLKAKVQTTATLKLDTSKTNPLLYFTDYDIDSFQNVPSKEEIEALAAGEASTGGYIEGTEMPTIDSETIENPFGFEDNSSQETSLTISGISIAANQQRTIRVYFKPFSPGNGLINTQAVAGAAVLNKEFRFNIHDARQLKISVLPSRVSLEEDFTISISDAETGTGIENATVHLKNFKGELAASMVGKPLAGKGKQGQYLFKNAFDPGLYRIEVSAAGYAAAEQEITISQDNLLELKKEFTLKIDKPPQGGTATESSSASLKNLSNMPIDRISYELVKPSSFPEEFYVSVEVPPSLNEKQEGRVSVNVEVNTEDLGDQSLYGQLELAVTGTVASQFQTKTTSTVKIYYNKKLDSGCLLFDKKEVRIRLSGNTNQTASQELEIENKCGEELSLSAVIDSEKADPNLNLSISPITIADGEKGIVQISASNGIERLYSVQASYKFDVEFESSKVSKSIPVYVELWNPRFSLAFPPDIAMWLARKEMETLARGDRELFINNNGQTPITSFRMAIEDQTFQRYPTLRVDLLPGGATDSTIYPGQPLTPTRYVHAEFAGKETIQNANGYVVFHGYVMGRDYPLGRTSVSVNYGGYDCLNISSDTDMRFSRTATYGVDHKDLIVTNGCNEPIRLTTVEPKFVQGNGLAIVPSDVILQPGETKRDIKLQLSVSKEARANAKVKVMGLLLNTQQFVQSNELPILVEIGETVTAKQGPATDKKSIPACGKPNEKVEVAFPKIGSDCANYYCDAKQMANYLAKEMDNLVKMAKQKIARGGNNAKNFPGCAGKSYCTFASMGISTQAIVVFMQLDSMTKDTLQHEVTAGNYSELKTIGSFSESELIKDPNQRDKWHEGIGTVGFGFGEIKLNGHFNGCGKYVVRLDGAAQVINDEIITEGKSFVLVANLVEQRGVTPECENAIYNIPNFLPLDEGYVEGETYGTWLGLVWNAEVQEADKLKKATEEFAKQLFKTKDGRIVKGAQNNTLKLVLSKTEGELLRIDIEGSGESDKPKIVTATIPKVKETDLDAIAKEAAEAISALKSGIVKGCIDPNKPPLYFKITEVSFIKKLLGELKINSTDKVIRINTIEQCIDFTVTSARKDEPIVIKTDFAQKKNKTGIEKLVIKNDKGETLLEELANATVSKESKSVRLSKEDEKAGLYYADLKLCLKGDALFSLASENVQNIEVTAISILGKSDKPGEEKLEVGDRKSDPPLAVKINSCGIHPKELVEKIVAEQNKIKNGEQKEFYATVSWKGAPEPPNKLDASSYKRLYQIMLENKGAEGPATGSTIGGLTSTEEQIKSHRVKAGIAYLGACMLPAWFMGAASPFFDCVLPWAWSNADLWEWSTEIKDFVKGFFGGLVKTAGNTISDIFSDEPSYAGRAPSAPSAQEANSNFVNAVRAADREGQGETSQITEARKQGFNELLNGGLMGVGAKSILVRGLGTTFGNINDATARWLVAKPGIGQAFRTGLGSTMGGSGLPEAIADDLIKRTFGEGAISATDEATKKAVGELRDKLVTTVRSDLEEKLFTNSLGRKVVNSSLKGKPITTLFDSGVVSSLYESGSRNMEDIASRMFLDTTTTGTTTTVNGWKSITGGTPEAETLRILQGRTNAIAKEACDRAQASAVSSLDGAAVTSWGTFDAAAGRVTGAYDDAVREITNTTWTKLQNEMGETLRKAGLGRADLERAIREVMPENPVNTVAERLRTAGVLTADDIARMTTRGNAEALLSMNAGQRAEMIDGLRRQAREAAENGITRFRTDPRNTAKLFQAQADDVIRRSSDDLAKAFRNNMDDLVKGKLKWYNKIGAGAWSIGKGVAAGAFVNFLGMMAYNAYWDYIGPNVVQTGSEINAKDIVAVYDADGKIVGHTEVDRDVELVKNNTYKITIGKSNTGKAHVTLVPVTTPQQFEEMDKAIKKDPAANWNTNCTDYWKKENGLYICVLTDMKPEKIKDKWKWKVTMDMVNAYTENCPTITYYEITPEYAIETEMILAVLFTKPDKIKGCNISEKWWKESEDTRKEMIKCAVGQLRSFIKEKKTLGDFIKLDSDAEAKEYADKILELQKQFNQFRTVSRKK